MSTKIAVVGAGVVGLSTAVQIKQLIPTASVTVIADKFTTDTTSHGAAGIFRPTLSKTPGVPLHLLRSWLRNSWEHYDALAHSEEAGLAGVQIISGYQFMDNNDPNILEKDLVYCYRSLTDKELGMFPGKKFKHGWFVTTMLVDPGKYLPYLTKQFVSLGGTITTRTLSSFEELVGQYDIVVNCTGFGSHQLLNDTQLVPNRGHLIKVKAPWIKHFVYVGSDGTCYILPGHDIVSIGGTRTDHDVDLKPRTEDHEKIFRDACSVLPSLKNATIVSDWVGLRPFRKPLRVEQELRQYPSGTLQLVHNYGHGAEGISLSWGTSMHATTIVSDLVRSIQSQSLKSKL